MKDLCVAQNFLDMEIIRDIRRQKFYLPSKFGIESVKTVKTLLASQSYCPLGGHLSMHRSMNPCSKYLIRARPVASYMP